MKTGTRLPDAAGRPFGRRYWAFGVLMIVTVGAYLPVLRSGFIWDDDAILTRNLLVKAADGLRWIWFSTKQTDYWPVTYTSFWIEWRLWGQNAAGYHATNLALHLADVLLLWAVFRRFEVPGAYLAALLFAVHPVNVESVAWIAERKNLLAMLFCLLSALAYPKAYGLSLLAFALAMLSKGSAAMLPIVLLGAAVWARPIGRRDLLRITPFFVVAVTLVLVDVWFQRHGAAIEFRRVGPLERLLGAAAAGWFYLLKSIFPAHLSFVYPQWRIDAADLRWWLPLLGAFAATAILVALRRRTAAFLAAWLYFWIMLIPALGFTDVYFMQYSLVADHYQHLALAGATAAVAMAWAAWRSRSRAADVAAVAAVSALAVLTWRQARIYRDPETLYRATLAQNPDAWLAHNNLAEILLADNSRIPEAIEHLKDAMRLDPASSRPHDGYGDALYRLGRYPEAVAELETALRLDPRDSAAHNNLGNVLDHSGHPREALAQYEEALRLDPTQIPPKFNLGGVHYRLGASLVKAGKLDEATREFEAALSYNPNLAEAHNDLGVIFYKTGRTAEAIAHLEAAVRINPDYAVARANLAKARR